MVRFFIYFITLLVSSVVQDASARQVAAESTRQFRIVFLQKKSSMPDNVTLHLDGIPQMSVPLPGYQFSKSISIKRSKSNVMVFAGKEYSDSTALQGFPSVSIPHSWSKFLLLAYEDSSNSKLPIKFYPINASPGAFSNGDIMFINHSSSTLTGTVGREKLQLSSQKTKLLSNISKHLSDAKVQIDIVSPRNKRQWFIYQAWKYRRDQRVLVYIHTPDQLLNPTYYSFEIRKF